jgi:hypothetical protein
VARAKAASTAIAVTATTVRAVRAKTVHKEI